MAVHERSKDDRKVGTSGGGGMKDALLIVPKFLFAVILLPVVVASTVAFQSQLVEFDPALLHALWVGLVSYVVMKFFVYDFEHVYRFGQTIVTFCFQFLKPLVNAAPYVLPIYTIGILIAYAIVNAMGKMGESKGFFFSMFAFSFVMHIVLTAQDLYKKDSSIAKPAYFFGMTLIYIFDVFFMALLMHLMLAGFSFSQFFQTLVNVAFEIYKAAFHQLF